MSHFRKLSHTIWHCQYHVVWVPKYPHRILTGRAAEEVARCVRACSERHQGEVGARNVQIDHVHLLVLVSPKVSVSDFVGTVNGRTTIRVFNKFRELKRRPLLGQSVLGARVLCRPRGLRRGEDPRVCAVSGRARRRR